LRAREFSKGHRYITQKTFRKRKMEKFNDDNETQKVMSSISEIASVVLLTGSTGVGKTFAVKSAVASVNKKTKNPKQKRRLIIFSPESLTTNEDMDLLQNALFAKDVTGIVPVVLIKSIEFLSTICLSKLKVWLTNFNQVKLSKERKALKNRNPVLLTSSGIYDTKINAFTRSFFKIDFLEPKLCKKITVAKDFFKENNIVFGKNIAAFVEDCDDFFVLFTRLEELKFGRQDLKHDCDRSSKAKLFDALKELRCMSKKESSSSEGIQFLLEGLGVDFAMRILQFNQPATKDQFEFVGENNQKTLVSSKMDQLSDFFDSYSELETCEFLMRDNNASFRHKLSMQKLPLVKSYDKIEIPNSKNFRKTNEIKTNIDLLVAEYTKTTKSFLKDIDALEVYSYSRDMHTSLNMFKPITSNDAQDESIDVINSQVKLCILRGLDSFPTKNAEKAQKSLSWKPKPKTVKKRGRSLANDVSAVVAVNPNKKSFFVPRRKKQSL
jgi:hypothetical protein